MIKLKELVQDYERFPFGIVGEVEIMRDKEDRHGFEFLHYKKLSEAVVVHGEEDLIQLFAGDHKIVFVVVRNREESSHDR